MELKQTLSRDDEREQRAALRESILRYGHLIGWSGRATIAFAEGVSRRPWKRCTSDQLAAVAEELQDVYRAGPAHQGAERRAALPSAPAYGDDHA